MNKSYTTKNTHEKRKKSPMFRGLLNYFPDALMYVSRVSLKGNEQHNPGTELHWDRSKSQDHADCIVRHLLEYDKLDGDELLHAGKVAWRSLALLQILLEQRNEAEIYEKNTRKNNRI